MLSTLFLSFLVLTSTAFNTAQPTFSMYINNRAVLKTQKVPQGESLKISIPRAKITNQFTIKIKWNESVAKSDWHRIFIFTNETGNEINRSIQKTMSGTFMITTLKLPDNIKTLKIVTATMPNDPDTAAVLRLRTFPFVEITIL